MTKKQDEKMRRRIQQVADLARHTLEIQPDIPPEACAALQMAVDLPELLRRLKGGDAE